MRHSGIEIIGDVPWGTHFCQFYEAKGDLIDVLVPYFRAGLENNEFCMWVTSEPLQAEEAKAALAKAVKNLGDYLRRGQIEILDYSQWYTIHGEFDSDRVLQGWVEKLEAARARGFDGLRLSGNTFWLENADWRDFTQYEARVNASIGRHPMLALCTYSLAKCGAAEIMDVVSNHAFALIKRAGQWQLIESAERKQAEEQIRHLASFPEMNPNPVIELDAQGDVTYINPAAREILKRLGMERNPSLFLPADISSIMSAGEGFFQREVAIGDRYFVEDIAAWKQLGIIRIYARDNTARRRAEDALRQSEQRVSLKLASILSPEGDLGNLTLGDIIDAPAIQSLMDDWYELVRIPMAIIDLKGEVLVGVGWQDVCTKFHRVHSDTCRHCLESDTQLALGVAAGEFKLYKCKNNMWDIATPMMIGDRHVGNLFSGQFFFKGEPFDENLFRSQARQYGFDEAAYLAALAAVPRLSRESVERGMSFLGKLGPMLSLLSYSNLKLARSLAERDALMDSLDRSREILNRAQEIAHLGSWELDVVNGRLSWSDEVYRIFGLQPQEFGATYEAFLAAVHPDDRKAVDAIFTASLNAGKPSYEATHRVVRRGTGEVRWVHEKCEFVSDANGRVIRAVGMVHDTTESKRAEEALRHASDQHRLALEAAGLGAWDYNLGKGEMVWDQRSRGMFGVPVDGPITYDRAVQCVHPEDRAAVEAAVKQALAWPGGAYHLEFRVVWPDGSVRWVDAHGRAQFEVEGGSYRAVRLVGVNADITDRKRAEESFYGAQKLESIGLLAGGIAHDFNNLLVGVVGNASLAEDLLPRGSPVVEILRRIIRSGEQAAHLTNQLLAYAGKGRFVVEPVNLSTLIQQGRALVQGSIPENIRLTLQLETSLPSVESDSSLVQQMFMNLALNAAEAIGDNSGVIAVTTGEMSVDAAYIEAELNDWPIEPGRCVFLEVRDNGCGMNAATKAKIFDPFFTTKFQGRGLGLAAVAGVVRAHKGAIKLTTAPGAGATFRVLLPAMASESVPSAPAARREDGPRGQSTVLVVDDEEMVRDVARRALERYGYEVLVAATGPAAIEIVRSHARRIRLVLLDLSMPGMSGKETLACLREVKPDLDVIISSGYSEAETLQRFDGIPLSGLIQKPYTVQQLARKVKAALG